MPRKKKNPEEVVETVEETPVVPTETEEVVHEGKSVSVFDERGNFVRKYSMYDHGHNYKALAGNFIADRKGYTLK